MMDINFSQIRTHNGSQAEGFEELICQLAHLSPPENKHYFVRKDGSGGDGGVECYWKLKDDSEHGWQAKYFIDSPKDSQWKQIQKSVLTALKKHPKLTKYYICLPRDRSDSRKSIKGKQTKSNLDIWEQYVKEWQKHSTSCGMKVHFEYWGQHEILLLLQNEQVKFSGCAKYWFDTTIFNMSNFQSLTEKSKKFLGERFTPEYNINLPIAKIFEGLCESSEWYNDIENERDEFYKIYLQQKESLENIPNISKKEIKEIDNSIVKINTKLKLDLKNQLFTCSLENYTKCLEELLKKVSDIQNKNPDRYKIIRPLSRLKDKVDRLLSFFKSDSCQVAKQKSLLLLGDAGIGKSHLLCDIALSRLKQNFPVVFVLGQHYSGGNPIEFLKKSFDIFNINKNTFLGALAAAGEAQGGHTLIIIDAINEGNSNKDWYNFISVLLLDLEEFSNISIVISCRTTYLNFLIPENINKQIVKVTHPGFKGYEHQAMVQYLGKKGIDMPSFPIMQPELMNPLFLKICSKAMHDQKMTSFPRGLNGLSNLMSFYIDGVENIIVKIKRFCSSEKIVTNALKNFALKLYPDNMSGLDINDTRELINQSDNRLPYAEPLFDLLIHEGVLSEDLFFNKNTEQSKPIIRFTYERFSDYFIALSLVDNLKPTKNKYNSLLPIFQSYNEYRGIQTILSIIIPEKDKVEMVDIFSSMPPEQSRVFQQIFINTIQWRHPNSFTERTLEIFSNIHYTQYYSRKIEILLALSTLPSHPWNADFTHNYLLSLNMAKRDYFWSTHLAISYMYSNNEQVSNVKTLIEWAYSVSLDNIEKEYIYLCSIILIWMHSTTNREVRDKATKSAIRILSNFPSLLIPLLKKFSKVDDLYVLERLYAIVYGVVTNSNDLEILKSVAEWIWEKQFGDGKPMPHLLLRDYARGILEYAYVKRQLSISVKPNLFRPPYKSKWPLDIPSNEDLKHQFEDKSLFAIKYSIMGDDFGIMGYDFGIYTMNCIHYWSPTSICTHSPQTVYELQIEFVNKYLNGELRNKFITYLNASKEQESIPLNIKDSKLFIDIRSDKDKPSKFELLKNKVLKTLNLSQKEEFRWVIGLGACLDSSGAFSRKSAQRWIFKRVLDLGWTKEFFESFETNYLRESDRSRKTTERIGKKYQWLALFEFLSYLSDNCHFIIDMASRDMKNPKYEGPWQLLKRDIDPTFTLPSTKKSNDDKVAQRCWWQPFEFKFSSGETLSELKKWLWDETIIPSFGKLLLVSDKTEIRWFALSGFQKFRKESKGSQKNLPSQDGWYRINSCIIHKNNFEEVEKSIKGMSFLRPNLIGGDDKVSGSFFREYPWHPIYKDISNWSDNFNFNPNQVCNVKKLVPTLRYYWEAVETDKSINDLIDICLPAKELINGLNLLPDMNKVGHWLDTKDKKIFYDPSVYESGPSVGLFRSESLYEWLEQNNFKIIWLVGGEKNLYSTSKWYGRLEYSGLYTFNNHKIEGDLWFNQLKSKS